MFFKFSSLNWGKNTSWQEVGRDLLKLTPELSTRPASTIDPAKANSQQSMQRPAGHPSRGWEWASASRMHQFYFPTTSKHPAETSLIHRLLHASSTTRIRACPDLICISGIRNQTTTQSQVVLLVQLNKQIDMLWVFFFFWENRAVTGQTSRWSGQQCFVLLLEWNAVEK